MRVWLITIGEPIPTDEGSPRLLRTGIIAAMMQARGWNVVWWSSTFDHQRKRQRAGSDRTIEIAPCYEIRLLRAPSYRKNISLRRMLNHLVLGRKLRWAMEKEPQPDVIVCSIPIVEMALPATRFANLHGIPILLDVRDLWPDIFVNVAPRVLRPVARVALMPLFRLTGRAFAWATAVIGTTPAFIEWGLALAGRSKSPLDRAFPHGYSIDLPPATALEDARHFWNARGVISEGFVVCFFGTFGNQFDLETVIDAAERVEADHIQFVLCGDGPKAEHYRRVAGRLRNVLFPGWVGAPQIWTLMERSAVGLAPYFNTFDFRASIANKAIEYLAGGLPVASSLSGMLEELLESTDCGFTYPEGDARALADGLLSLKNDPARRRRLAINARKTYEERFVAQRVYGDLIELLASIAGATASQRILPTGRGTDS